MRRAERKAAKKPKRQIGKASDVLSAVVEQIQFGTPLDTEHALRKAAAMAVSNKQRLEAMREQGFTRENTDAKFFEQPEEPLWSVDPGQDTSDELTIGNRGDARMVELQKIAQGLEAELRRHDEIAIAEFIESVALKKAYITPSPTANFLCIPLSQINAILRALQKK